MSGYPGAQQITVTFEFPNGDQHAQPRATRQSPSLPEIKDDANGIYWASTSNLGWQHDDRLTITGITFYSDPGKTQEVTPSYLSMPGQNFGRLNWIIRFNGQAIDSEQTLYYTLHFQDADFANLEWDPTIKVKPRSAAQPPAQSGAGA